MAEKKWENFSQNVRILQLYDALVCHLEIAVVVKIQQKLYNTRSTVWQRQHETPHYHKRTTTTPVQQTKVTGDYVISKHCTK